MAEDPQFEALREAGWRRRLTPEEEAQLASWLARHPYRREDWEEEQTLTHAIQRLGNVPVPGNFTARVLDGVARAEAAEARHRKRRVWRHLRSSWLPRLAFGVVLLTAGVSSYQYMEMVQRAHLVESVAAVSQVSSLPGPEILKDFDAILALDRMSGPDEELLRLLE